MPITPDRVINHDGNVIQKGVYTWFEDAEGMQWLTDGHSFACFGSVFHSYSPMKDYFRNCCVTGRVPFKDLIMNRYTVTGLEIVHGTAVIPESI